MRKILSLFAIASMLVATSCSNEEFFDSAKNGTEANVSFTAQLPEGLQTKVTTRAYGKGEKATQLTCAVYDADWVLLQDLGENKTLTNGKTTVDLRLVNGKSYNIVFWADSYGSEATDAAIEFDQAEAKVKVDYDKITANSEALDAFFSVEKITVNGNVTNDVKLKRPFAQLNIGTSDWADVEKSVTITQTGVKVKGIYNTLSLKDESVSGGEEELVTFALADLPSEDEEFPVKGGYTYLSMNYLLVGQEKSNVEVTIMYDEASGVQPYEIDKNIPVQRNYRTNLYGKLITSQSDWNVSIDYLFDEPSNDIPIWDGTTKDKPAVSDDGTTYLISTAAEWAYLAEQGSTNGKKIELSQNLDFGGHTISNLALSAGGELNGNNHTMSNMTISPAKDGYAIGLINGDGTRGNVTIKDITLSDVNIDNKNTTTGGFAGVVFGAIQNGDVTMENVHVVNSKIKGMISVGGLVGFVASGRTLTLNNCSVKNSDISNYAVSNESGFVAGLVGRPVGTVVGQGNAVENVTIVAYYAAKRGENSIQEIVGGNSSVSATTVNNSVTKYAVEKTISVSSTEELKNALESDENTDKTILLATNTEFDEITVSKVASNLTIEGDGKTTVVKGIKVDETDIEGLTLKNIVFKDKGMYLSFTSTPHNKVSKLTMQNCTMTGSGQDNSTAMGNRLFDIGTDSFGSNQLIDVTIEGCTVSDVYQGIRLGGLEGNTTIKNNSISNVGHNAITLRSTSATNSTILVENNVITNGADRAFRIGTVNAGTVTYKNNTITNTGDTDGENFKANTINGTVTFTGNTVNGTTWGEGTYTSATNF